jgi:23S rRNA pseudouridine955/2504/2580 synthase
VTIIRQTRCPLTTAANPTTSLRRILTIADRVPGDVVGKPRCLSRKGRGVPSRTVFSQNKRQEALSLWYERAATTRDNRVWSAIAGSMERKTFIVDAMDGNTRLDRWCQRILGSAPNSVYQKALRSGRVRLNGKKAEGNKRVFEGDSVEVRGDIISPDKAQAPREKQPMKLTLELAEEAQGFVLYRDKDILVINKPAGLAVQGGSKVSKHLDGMLPALQFDGKQVPRLVHRLDKDTSGVMLLARHSAAASELQKAFLHKTIRKTYLALVVGVPQPYEGEIESNLDKRAHEDGGYEKMLSVDADDDGKKAITRYRTLEHLAKKIALVELEPITGRTHQLRVHMAELGCPILGDGKYGGKDAHIGGGVELSGRLHLQAWRIHLPPLFGKGERSFEAPIAAHIARSLDGLGLSVKG